MKFFNSDKSGFLSFVAKRMKALFALFFIIAGTSSVWGQNPELSWTYASDMSGWADAFGKSEYTFIRQDVVFADNNYTHYLDIEFQSAGTDNYKLIEDGKNWYGMETTIPYQCKWWEWKSGAGNTAFQHNAGKYRFYINANSDQRKITVTGIFVTIDDEPVNNGDGTYTITGHYTNANPGLQNINTCQIVFSEGVGVGANETATVGEDGSFSITKQLVEGQQYTCCARAIDGSIGNHDSEYITFTAQAATPEPEPTVTDLYLRGDQMGWGAQSSDEWKQTSVSSDGNVYTWDWTSAPKTIRGNFKIAALPADGGWDNSNNFGPKGNDVTLPFENGVATVTVWSDGGSKNINTTEQVSKIEFDKAALTVTFYTTEQPTPVFGATITATPGTEQIDLTSILTESVAGTDLTAATCQFQYKAADAGDETYDDMSEPASVIYNGEGATRTATLSQSMAAGDYVFRAVWTYNSAVVANAVTETVTIPSDTPTPTDLNLYVRGKSYNDWGYPGEEFKGITEDGIIYTWDWTESPKEMSGPFKIAYCNIENPGNWNNDLNFGLENAATLTFGADGTWTGKLVKNESGDMTIDPARNVKKITFKYDTKELLIETEISSSCQDLVDGFTISGRFNAGIEDADGLYQGRPISSKEADPANGYWSDGARFIQLTANNVPANYFDWECTTYAIDGVEKTIPDIAWTDKDKTSARAELSLPGTYTFVCKARCNETDEWTYSEELTITAPAPAMGFDGPAFVGSSWDHASAGREGEGLMTRQNGTLTWKSRKLQVGVFDNEAQFVVIQRYKTLGCVSLAEGSSDPESKGWTGHDECGESLSRPDNKVNRAETLSFENITGSTGANFVPSNPGAWVANETQLQLVVTMTGWDSYTVALEEVSQECTTPADNFPISAKLNQGAGTPFEGNLVASGSNTATGGYFADDFRTVTLTTTQVADTYEWKLVGYAIDGNPQATADLTTLATITNGDAQTATALLNLPGDYTFQCTAACTDGTPVNSATVTISTYPEIGFDGPIGTPANLTTENNGWNHAWAAEENNGLLERQLGTLTWTNTFTYQNVNNLTDFVVIQRYKLGCVATPKGYEGRPEYLGWAGHDECPGQSIVNSGNKINASANISFQGYAVSSNPGEQNMNFIASGEKVSSWISGETQLTLTVTMTGWDSYTVELAKKQEQIKANYSSNDVTKGTVTMKVGDTQIDNGDEITDYIGQQVTLIATPAQGYKVASWKINGKVTESDRTTISPTLSGEGLNVVVTFERDCYSGVVYDLNGGGIICANGGSTELSLNTLNNVTYQLYKNGAPYGEAVPGNGEAAKWTISEAGTYTAKSYDSRFGECQEQAIDMNGSAVVTTVTAPKITVNPGDNVHLTVLQARSFTAKVPVDGSITDVTGSGARNAPMNTIPVDWSITEVTGSGDYCEGDGYMISSQTDTSLVAKFLCIGTAKITATMKAPNQNCKAVVTVHQNGAETEVCAPEPEDMQ